MDDLLAEAAIRDVQIRYCRAVDRMDFDLLRSCFHADATTDYGFFAGDVDGFIEMARNGLVRYRWTTHFTGNQLVEVNGDAAWAEHYAVATHLCPADAKGSDREYICRIRYVDRMERRDDDWRIAKRVLVVDSARTDPIPEAGSGRPSSSGKRDQSDPSYLLR